MSRAITTTMAFIVPESVKCPKCNYTTHANQGETFCPRCYADFLRLHIPVMVPDPCGKPFNPNEQTVTL